MSAYLLKSPYFLFSKHRVNLVWPEGLEPSHLSASPPQDDVSANSTTATNLGVPKRSRTSTGDFTPNGLSARRGCHFAIDTKLGAWGRI